MLSLMPLRAITVRLREVPGGVLINEIVRRAFGRGSHIVEIGNFDRNIRLRLDLSEHMQSQIFWHGSYSRNILFLLDRVLKPGMTVIDAGANIGEISLFAAKRVGPEGAVHAFEPMGRFADQLQRNVGSNAFGNVTIHRKGLLDVAGELPIYVADRPYRDGTRHDGLGTLFASDQRSRSECTIPTVTLDHFALEQKLGRVDLLKLDIEGSELHALRGGRELLRRFKPSIIVEVGRETCRAAGYEMEDVVSLLEDLDYSIYKIGRRGRLDPLADTGLAQFQNLFCVPTLLTHSRHRGGQSWR